jgi:membrane protease YdiL (CAAX protease family)
MPSIVLNNFRQGFIRMSPPVKILLLVIMVGFFLIFSSILAFVLAFPIFNLNLSELYEIIGNPEAENIHVLKFFQVVQSVFLFIVPAAIAAWLFSTDTAGYLKCRVSPSGYSLLLVTLSLVVAVPFMNSLAELNSGLDLPSWMDSIERKIRAMEESAGKITGLFLKSSNINGLLVNMLMIAILPAIGEEFLFRGLFQRLFTEWTRNKHIGIIISAFVFSFIHFQFYGFFPRFFLGLYFGYLLLWSSSIWVPVLAHFMNNGFAVIYYYYAPQPMGETAMDKLGTEPSNNYTIYLSIFMTTMLIGLIYLNEVRRRKSEF